MKPTQSDTDSRVRRAYRLALMFAACALAFSVAFVGLLLAQRAPSDPRLLWSDERVRQEAIRELVAASGRYDSHPDADVGRVLQPNLDAHATGNGQVSSNSMGMREREFTLRKPDDVIRIILLGNSLVYGLGIPADERIGVHLEREIRSRAVLAGREVECLHFAISSWNIIAECAFLRRQLSLARPDLVVHVIANNDLNDNSGVRGFGAASSVTDQFRARANGIIAHAFDRGSEGRLIARFLPFGIDHESRSRFARASAAMEQLARAIEQGGGKYLVVNHPSNLAWAFRQNLFQGLANDQVLYLPASFSRDVRYQISESDWHWNPEGSRVMATILYGILRQRDLLPMVELPAWPEAQSLASRIAAEGRGESERPLDLSRQRWRNLSHTIRFDPLPGESLHQIHGGIDEAGQLAPYASLLLRRPKHAAFLEVTGNCIDRPEIDGHLRVFVDELQVAEIDLTPPTESSLRVPLPETLAGRDFVSVRFEATDYAYDPTDLRSCISYRLRSVALVR